MADLPQTVAGATLNDHDTTVATWGDPHIVLRCGVDKPAGLQPTSPCDVVNDVGWFSEQIDDGWRFTTIGRAGNIEVTVPTSYAPQADALVDLSAAIKKMPQVRACQLDTPRSAQAEGPFQSQLNELTDNLGVRHATGLPHKWES